MTARDKRARRGRHFTDTHRVQEELKILEQRLQEISFDGDCAYERAMIRFFEDQASMRRNWLAETRMVAN